MPSKSKVYEHTERASAKFRHEVLHVDKAGLLIAEMKRKAKRLGLPPRMPLSQLTRIAIQAWLNLKPL